MARSQRDAFRAAFAEPDCDDVVCIDIACIGPEYARDWQENKYAARCNAGSCEPDVRQQAWSACDDMTACPASYECRFGNGFEACWYLDDE